VVSGELETDLVGLLLSQCSEERLQHGALCCIAVHDGGALRSVEMPPRILWQELQDHADPSVDNRTRASTTTHATLA
jgi:hypothetical protein